MKNVAKLNLPKKSLSWSQISKWLKSSTHRDYIRYYMFGDKTFFENDYLLFGSYISDLMENYHVLDIAKQPQIVQDVISQLDVLDVPEMELTIDYDNFSVIGYADDATKDARKIREWKTGKLWDQKKVDAHGQLDTYASSVHKKYGYIPEIVLSSMETKPVEESVVKYKDRDLKVSFTGEVRHFERVVTMDDINKIDKIYKETAQEISDYWNIFCKLANV